MQPSVLFFHLRTLDASVAVRPSNRQSMGCGNDVKGMDKLFDTISLKAGGDVKFYGGTFWASAVTDPLRVTSCLRGHAQTPCSASSTYCRLTLHKAEYVFTGKSHFEWCPNGLDGLCQRGPHQRWSSPLDPLHPDAVWFEVLFRSCPLVPSRGLRLPQPLALLLVPVGVAAQRTRD